MPAEFVEKKVRAGKKVSRRERTCEDKNFYRRKEAAI